VFTWLLSWRFERKILERAFDPSGKRRTENKSVKLSSPSSPVQYLLWFFFFSSHTCFLWSASAWIARRWSIWFDDDDFRKESLRTNTNWTKIDKSFSNWNDDLWSSESFFRFCVSDDEFWWRIEFVRVLDWEFLEGSWWTSMKFFNLCVLIVTNWRENVWFCLWCVGTLWLIFFSVALMTQPYIGCHVASEPLRTCHVSGLALDWNLTLLPWGTSLQFLRLKGPTCKL